MKVLRQLDRLLARLMLVLAALVALGGIAGGIVTGQGWLISFGILAGILGAVYVASLLYLARSRHH